MKSEGEYKGIHKMNDLVYLPGHPLHQIPMQSLAAIYFLCHQQKIGAHSTCGTWEKWYREVNNTWDMTWNDPKTNLLLWIDILYSLCHFVVSSYKCFHMDVLLEILNNMVFAFPPIILYGSWHWWTCAWTTTSYKALFFTIPLHQAQAYAHNQRMSSHNASYGSG